MKHYEKLRILLCLSGKYWLTRVILCGCIALNPLLVIPLEGMTIPLPEILITVVEKALPVVVGALTAVGVGKQAAHITRNREYRRLEQQDSHNQETQKVQPISISKPVSTSTASRNEPSALPELFKLPFEKKLTEPFPFGYGVQEIIQQELQAATRTAQEIVRAAPANTQVHAPPKKNEARVVIHAGGHVKTAIADNAHTLQPTPIQVSVPVSARPQEVVEPERVTTPAFTCAEACAPATTFTRNQSYVPEYVSEQVYGQNQTYAQDAAYPYVQAQAYDQAQTQAQIQVSTQVCTQAQPQACAPTYVSNQGDNQAQPHIYWNVAEYAQVQAQIQQYVQAQAEAQAAQICAYLQAQAYPQASRYVPTQTLGQINAQVEALNRVNSPHYNQPYIYVNSSAAYPQAQTKNSTEAKASAVSRPLVKTGPQEYQSPEEFDRFLDANPKIKIDYNATVNAYADIVMNSCNANLALKDRYLALLQANACRIRGVFGSQLNCLVRKLNYLYFDQLGNLKSFINSPSICKELENLLFNFFASAATSRQHFLNCIKAARSKGLTLCCNYTLQNVLAHLQRNNYRFSSVANWGNRLHELDHSIVANNSQNRGYLNFRHYCSVDSKLPLQKIVEKLNQAKRIFLEQKCAFPRSLTTQQMESDLAQAYTQLNSLSALNSNQQHCSDSVPLLDQPQEPQGSKSNPLPGAPPLEAPIPPPNIDIPEIRLPTGRCGTLPDVPVVKPICPDSANPSDTIEPHQCNYSKTSNMPAFEVEPQVINQTPSPDPDYTNTDSAGQEPIPQVPAMIPAVEDTAIVETPTLAETDKQEKKRKNNKTYQERIDEIKALLSEKIQQLEDQLLKESALTSILAERLAIEQRIRQAIEDENTKSWQKILKITDAQNKSKLQRAQETLKKEQAAQGLTADNLPEIKTEDYHERIDVDLVRKFIEKYKFITGALNTDGPLTRILTKGLRECPSGSINRAEGAIKELLTADMFEHEIIKAFDKVVKIIESIHNKLGLNIRRTEVEFDIETERSLIEVKGGEWKEFFYLETLDNYELDSLSELSWEEFETLINKISDNQVDKQSLRSVYDILKNFLVQKEMANIMNKEFILIYFNDLPLSLKEWLKKETIKFTEYKR